MPKEILIYGDIFAFTSREFIDSVEEQAGEDIAVRINSNGGSPEAAFGMIAKFQEHEGRKLVKVDGKAHSMMALFLAYADDVQALDVSEFLIHRAAFARFLEEDETFFTDDVRAMLERMNKNLMNAFIAKVDVKKFEALKQVKAKGLTVKAIFSLENRHEVILTSADAKKVGLINRIVKITPQMTAQIDELFSAMAKGEDIYEIAAKHDSQANIPINNKPETQNTNTMDLHELQTKHPVLYAQVVTAATKTELDRVKACLVFVDIDAKGVKEAIASGEPLSFEAMAEFSRKVAAAALVTGAKGDSAKPVATEEVDEAAAKTAKEKEVANFEAEARAQVGLPEAK